MSTPRFLKRNMRQTAVYWAVTSADGRGWFNFATPEEVSCRWENRQEAFVDANGEEHLSIAVVTTTEDVTLNGLLFLGTLDDLSDAEESDPSTVDNALIIRARNKTSGVKNRYYKRTVFLTSK